MYEEIEKLVKQKKLKELEKYILTHAGCLKPVYFTCGCGCGMRFEDDNPLYIAGRYNNLEAAKIMVKHGAEISECSLRYAWPKAKEVFAYLNQQTCGIYIDGTNGNTGDTLLYAAVSGKRFKDALFLLEQGANPKRSFVVGMYNRENKYTLPLIMESGNMPLIKAVVDKLKNIDVTEKYDNKSLWNYMNQEVKTFFLKREKDRKRKILTFDEMPTLETLKQMKSLGYNYEEPIVASKQAKGPFCKMRRKNKKQPMLQVFLCEALWQGNIEMAKFLINDGATLNPKDNEVTSWFDVMDDYNPIMAVLAGRKAESLDFALDAGMEIKLGSGWNSVFNKIIYELNFPVLSCLVKHKVKLPDYNIKEKILSMLIEGAYRQEKDAAEKARGVIKLFKQIDDTKQKSLRRLTHQKNAVNANKQKQKEE